MHYAFAVFLILLWFLGMLTATMAGGLIHMLLVLAVATVLMRIISGRGVW